MKIAYIGTESGTSLQRARALERLGHEVHIVDPWAWLHSTSLSTRANYHSGYILAGVLIDDKLVDMVFGIKPDLIWVNQGEFLGSSVIGRLKRLSVPIINYANDNPFSSENRKRFHRYRSALPYYDLVVVVFEDAVKPARLAGAKNVIRKCISADEIAHLAYRHNEIDKSKYASDVVFVGTWMKEQRGAFIVELIRLGVPVSVWGDNWHKDKEWRIIKQHWRGPGVYDESEYAAILRSAKICLGLVNKASGNLHTDRSIQVPALGALLCAERTSEHLAMYEEGKEAVFWKDAYECASICRELLKDDNRRIEIALKGLSRAEKNNLFNEPVLNAILEQAVKG